MPEEPNYKYYKCLYHAEPEDEVAEWLRRWTANPLGPARVGSNPILVDLFHVLSICKLL